MTAASKAPTKAAPLYVVSEGQRDADIILGLAEHDEAALRRLIDTCAKYVYGKALQIVREPSLAEEVAQDTMLVLWWDPTRFDATKGSLRSFLIGVARFKAIDLVRREEMIRSRGELLVEARSFFEIPSADRGVEDRMVVQSAIAKLPLSKREVIYLAYYKGLTYREVAALLGVPEGTVKTRIRDALIRLRAGMARPETG
jgi:RNA polymerase sigma-70 factor, ECF subfamily